MDFRDEQLQRQQQQQEMMVHAPVEQEALQNRQNFLENPQQVQEIQQAPVLRQAPVHLPEEGQQQQMSRKEQKAQLRRQEKERNEKRIKHEKNVAKARRQIDKTVAEIRKKQKSGIPDTDMTLSEFRVCEERAQPLVERLERMIVTKVRDVRQATEYLNKVKELQDMVQKRDQLIRGLRMRAIQASMLIKDVPEEELPEGIREAVTESINQEQEMIENDPFQTKFDDLQRKIFVTDEELRQAERRDRRQVKAYEQRLQEIMQQSPGITRERARDQYLSETLCPTLKNFEQARKKDSEEIRKTDIEEKEYYDVMGAANDFLKDALKQDVNLTREDAVALTNEYLHDYMNQQNAFQIRVPNCDIMQKIIRAGRFKTQMETGKSVGGVTVVETRKEFTKRKFGADVDTLPDDMYEIYGYISHGDLVKESAPDSHIGNSIAQYGRIIVKLKKDRLKNRTTAVIGDSLSRRNDTNAAWLDRMDYQSVGINVRANVIKNAYLYNKAKEANSENVSEFLDYEKMMQDNQICYTELQFHGQVTLDDIESVTLVDNKKLETEDETKTEAEKPMTKDEKKIKLEKMLKKKLEKMEAERWEELQKMLRSLGIKAQVVKEDGLHEL